MLAFNQERLIEEAFDSLLDQDLDNLEIVVSDDCSSDNTWEKIANIQQNYCGSKKLIINRNQDNLGVIGNFNKAVSLSTGDVIFIAHGDDISMPNRCSLCLKEWDKYGRIPDLLATDAYDIKLSGEILGIKKTDNLQIWNIDKWISSRPYIFGASHMVTRKLLKVAELSPRLPYEDQCLLFRSLLMGGAVRLPLPLIKHRRGGVSQQSINYSYNIKIKRLIKSSFDTEFECKQMFNDAVALKANPKVFTKLNENLEIAFYKNRVLSAEKVREKKDIFFNSPNVSLLKKIRYFQFSTLPYFHRVVMRLNELISR